MAKELSKNNWDSFNIHYKQAKIFFVVKNWSLKIHPKRDLNSVTQLELERWCRPLNRHGWVKLKVIWKINLQLKKVNIALIKIPRKSLSSEGFSYVAHLSHVFIQHMCINWEPKKAKIVVFSVRLNKLRSRLDSNWASMTQDLTQLRSSSWDPDSPKFGPYKKYFGATKYKPLCQLNPCLSKSAKRIKF